MLPWAKANLNPTGQALIVCTVAGMAYFVAADKTILSLARRHSYESAPDHLKDTSFHGAAAITAKMSSTATVTGANPENKLALAKRCSREATLAGAKAAALATVASAAATLASVRMLPWAKANLNPTGQALIICTVAGMAYFVAADKTILSLARRHSYESAPDHLKDTSFHGAAPRPRPPPPAFFSP
ncbi:early nodulin-93 [Hordeum vulgare]|nr:early nodulin-93 [Hordeum vulgare]